MPTPESAVKKEVKKVVDRYGDKIDSFWPVPSGYGESHLDCILCVNGYFVSIETKAAGKKPSPRQKERIRRVENAGGRALVIDGTDKTFTYDQLDALLYTLVYS